MTVSKVIIGNGGFTVACVNLMVFQHGGRKRLNRLKLQSSLTLTTRNANCHCPVGFYTFVGQHLTKQL